MTLSLQSGPWPVTGAAFLCWFTCRGLSDPTISTGCPQVRSHRSGLQASFLGGFKVQSRRQAQNAALAGLADYSGQAAKLFDNMRAPAALLAGALVPLGFFAAPKLDSSDEAWLRRAKQLHYALAAFSICCQLTTVVWSTITLNKLNETATPPMRSVAHLLQTEFELPWVGCNVNFILGLLGFGSCLISFSFISFGRMSKPVACIIGAALSLQISIVNTGVQQGDGIDGGIRFGCSFVGLCGRYVWLLFSHAMRGPKPLLLLSGAFALASLVLSVKSPRT